jgi:hypothetical protein
MFVRDALRACPSLVTIPTSPQLFEQCAAVARLLYWSILHLSEHMHPLSCDELYVRLPHHASDTSTLREVRPH